MKNDPNLEVKACENSCEIVSIVRGTFKVEPGEQMKLTLACGYPSSKDKYSDDFRVEITREIAEIKDNTPPEDACAPNRLMGSLKANKLNMTIFEAGTYTVTIYHNSCSDCGVNASIDHALIPCCS